MENDCSQPTKEDMTGSEDQIEYFDEEPGFNNENNDDTSSDSDETDSKSSIDVDDVSSIFETSKWFICFKSSIITKAKILIE